MIHERDSLGYGRIFAFWYPLALTWLMMAAEGPFLAAVVARMARPKENLAAYGIALAVAILVEAPIIMMMSAATALVRDRDSFLKLRAFTHALNLFITLAMALLLFSGAMDFICRSWIGLSEPVTRRVYGALVLLLPWPGAIGYRRFYQGVLIRSGLTRRVAYGTVVRLCSMAACALLLFGFSHMHGADTAAAALSTGVIMEAAAARLMAFTTLADFWFEKVSGLERFLADFAVLPTLVLTPFPALTVLLSMERAVLVKGGRTPPVTHATLLEVAGVLAVLYTGVEPLHLTGAVAASVALISGRSLGILYLLLPCRAVLRGAGRP